MRFVKSQSQVTLAQILAAYKRGVFPMATGRYGEIDWFIADPRTVIPLDERFRIRRSLRQAMRKLDYETRINTAFAEVIRACARHRVLGRDSIWLSEEMIELYTELHRLGFVHSVEVWMDGEL